MAGALIIAAAPPEIGKDSQYYLQAGHLWASGQVTYAGSLIGSRIFAVLAYLAPQMAFGASMDSVALGLAAIWLAYGLITIAWIYIAVPAGRRLLVAIVVLVASFVWMRWDNPLTDQFAVVVAVAALFCLDMSRRADSTLKAVLFLAAAAVICGLGVGFRSEPILMVAIAVGMVFLGHPAIRTWGERALATAALVGCFVVAAQTPPMTFRAFTGVPLPDQVNGYFLFFQTVNSFGDRSLGLNSDQLFRLGQEVQSSRPDLAALSTIRVGYPEAYSRGGARLASDLYGGAGIETMMGRPFDVLSFVSGTLSRYLFTQPAIFEVDYSTASEREARTAQRLTEIDEMRLRESDRFGKDATWPVSSLLASRLPIVTDWLSPIRNLPTVRYSPPAWLFTALALLAAIAAARRGGVTEPVILAFCFFVASIGVAAFSQGFVHRYWASASLPLLISGLIFCAQGGALRARQWRST